MAEAQKNVPIDETFHDQLKRIAIIDKTSMKNTVQKWIKKDGRGVAPSTKEPRKEEPKKEEQKHGDLLDVVSKQQETQSPASSVAPFAPPES